MEMNRLTRDGTAEPVSRDQILRHERGQGNMHFPCSANHEQDWQPSSVDSYSASCDDHTTPRITVFTTQREMYGLRARVPLALNERPSRATTTPSLFKIQSHVSIGTTVRRSRDASLFVLKNFALWEVDVDVNLETFWLTVLINRYDFSQTVPPAVSMLRGSRSETGHKGRPCFWMIRGHD